MRQRASSFGRILPILAVLLVFSHLVRGGFSGLERLGWWEVAILGLLLLGICSSAVRYFRRTASGAPRLLRDDLEFGSSLIAAGYTVVSIGGPALFPIVYLLMAFVVSFLRRAAGLSLVGVALVFDVVTTMVLEGPALGTLVPHAAFLILFAVLYHLVLTARLLASRRAEQQAVKRRIAEVEERARTFRLVSSGSEDSHPDLEGREKWLMASVKEIEGAMGAALEIAEIALQTHTCAAFLLSADDRFFKLYECRSSSDAVHRDRFPAGEGILGGVVRRKVPVRMSSPKSLKGLTHYESNARRICSLLAVPILEGSGAARGVLLADRVEAQAFTENDERLLAAIASEVWRSMEVERVMGYIRRARDEKDRFFRAIEEMNRAGNPEQVFLAVIESVGRLAELDFCALTLVSEENGKRIHRVVRTAGAAGRYRALEGRTFADNNGLVANVVRYGTPLPGRELQAMDRQIIFDEDIRIRGLAALRIFPLNAANRSLGTLVVGARSKTAMDQESLRMIEVIAIQAAEAVLRAQFFDQMEQMAITDGLTGLLNHRAFQAKADEALAQARRYGRRCSLVLIDVDHFKSVNDTYGHPAGDLVLKGVAQLLRQKGRDTDIVARYGGEEFAIVMPETDSHGARVIAERIRECVSSNAFSTELGPIKVTVSAGVATFPLDANEKQELIDLADQALYQAKRQGRNRTLSASQLRAPERAQGTG